MVTAAATPPRRLLQAFSRYRPRFLTLLVVPLTAAIVVLSNVSGVGGHLGRDIICQNYGWPMVWWRFVAIPPLTGGYQIHRLRLAADVAVWLLILISAGGGCEWLTRRYRLRLRWSLRTMLVITALVAAGCGWFAVASRRAAQQDDIVALIQGRGIGGVWIERGGPGWLGFLGGDRYFQRLTGARVFSTYRPEDSPERILNRLKYVPSVRLLCLSLGGNSLSPALVESLNAMPQLRILEVAEDTAVADRSTDQAVALGDTCLAAIGRMNHLEQLCLKCPSGNAFAELAGLRRLRGLHLEFESEEYEDDYDPYASPPLLASLPVFARLETLTFDGPYLVDDDLRRIAAQPHLKALRIFAPYIFADLAALRAIDGLEELTIVAPLQPADILAFSGLNRLKTLHINDIYDEGLPDTLEEDFDADKPQPPAEFDRQALLALRRSRSGLVIDGDTLALHWDIYRAVPPKYVQPTGATRALSDAAPWLHAWFWTRGDLLIRDMNLPW